MPNRLICGVILIFWTIAAGALFTRDVLPTLLVGPPPDMRTIMKADDSAGPVRWSILALNEDHAQNMRAVGQISTLTKRQGDGWVRLTSEAWLDLAEMSRKESNESNLVGRVGVIGSCEIDPSGNLSHFRVGIREGDGPRAVEMLTLEGRHRKDQLDVTARSLIGGEWHRSIAYRPREIVQNSLGPIDRMPGLQVGQKWESQMISPLSMLGFGMGDQIQTCRTEVVGVEHMVWDNDTISVLKVVTKMGAISVSTWVRPDGLVVRQELPYPTKGGKLILDRLPEDPISSKPPAETAR